MKIAALALMLLAAPPAFGEPLNVVDARMAGCEMAGTFLVPTAPDSPETMRCVGSVRSMIFALLLHDVICPKGGTVEPTTTILIAIEIGKEWKAVLRKRHTTEPFEAYIYAGVVHRFPRCAAS